MYEKEDCNALKNILNQSLKIFLERTKIVGIENAFDRLPIFESDFKSIENLYESIWLDSLRLLPNYYDDCNFSKSLFAYGPKYWTGMTNKEFLNCNFSQSLWYFFKHSDNLFKNCNFTNANIIMSNGIKNKYNGCNFTNAHFLSFYPYGGNDYSSSRFSNAIIEFNDWMCVEKGHSNPDSIFTDTELKGCRIVFDKSYKKVPRSD